jgi:hypothetical protein
MKGATIAAFQPSRNLGAIVLEPVAALRQYEVE